MSNISLQNFYAVLKDNCYMQAVFSGLARLHWPDCAQASRLSPVAALLDGLRTGSPLDLFNARLSCWRRRFICIQKVQSFIL
jgi:hypothetical protein